MYPCTPYTDCVFRVWHDNSGSDPAWNFSRMQVTDLQTAEKFFFVLDRWLAVDRDDGCVSLISGISKCGVLKTIRQCILFCLLGFQDISVNDMFISF